MNKQELDNLLNVLRSINLKEVRDTRPTCDTYFYTSSDPEQSGFHCMNNPNHEGPHYNTGYRGRGKYVIAWTTKESA